MIKCDLVIFTCQGREHLLPQTYKSFKENCSYTFDKVILAIDGKIDEKVINVISPDYVVRNFDRKGYIFNILNAISLITSEFFFWLEDDFVFEQQIQFDLILATLKEQDNWAGIFLSRTAPLSNKEKERYHFGNYYIPHFGYSVSPTLCRTRYLKAAFAELILYPKSEETKTYGFETFIDDYFVKNQLSYALLDPGNVPHVTHAGKLESSERSYHMINSLDPKFTLVNKDYLSAFGHDRKISIINKLSMLPKLTAAFFVLAFGLFRERRLYDYAFRIYLSYRNKFNN